MTGIRSNIPNTPEEAAAEWLARRAAGLDLSTEPAFGAWLAQSPLHEDAWSKAEHLWASFDAQPDMLLAAMRQVALEARAESDGDLDDLDDIPAFRSPKKAKWPRAAAAFAVAASLVLGVRTFWHPEWPGLTTPAPHVAERRYESPADGRLTVQLADQTTVTMDRDTAIVARLSADSREINLVRGQAYFAVRHDAARPFTVMAAGGSVTDLGTKFNVMTDVNGMRVLVVEGSVAVRNGAASQTLVSGDGYDSSTATRSHFGLSDMLSLLAWRTGYLEFHNERLAQAISDMNRYGGHRIVLADPSMGSLPIAGRYEIGNNERFARTLTQIYGLKMSQRPDGTILLRSADR